jgi:RNA polymerase sigma-70 factor (ECF subfamily)
LEEVPAENVFCFDANRQIEIGEVLEAFNRLTAEHRAVLVLVAVEEMSYREAASVLEVPIGTVMSRLNRARTELRSLLGQERDRSLRGSGPIQQRF